MIPDKLGVSTDRLEENGDFPDLVDVLRNPGLSFGAFLTGSQAYGIPRELSDLDIAMLVSQEELESILDRYRPHPPHRQYTPDSCSLKFGAAGVGSGCVNLILFSDITRYAAWKAARDELVLTKPNTKQKCIDVHIKHDKAQFVPPDPVTAEHGEQVPPEWF